MRLALALAASVLVAAPARAQDAPASPETDEHERPEGAEASERAEPPSEGAEPTERAEPAEQAEPARAGDASEAPKVAVVVAGDPDEALRDAARRVERSVSPRLRLPFDPGLRAALRGERGEADDGLEEVRRQRRRLAVDEPADAPLLASLGRRAGAHVVAVVRAGETAPELVVLDVRNAAFYEGTLALSGDVSDARIARFVGTRARAAARGTPSERPPPPASAATSTEQPARQPDFFEQFWPYFVAGALLAGLLIAILVTSATAGSDQPVLRFVPGDR